MFRIRRWFVIASLLLLGVFVNSCGLYYRLHKSKAQKTQAKADRKKEEDWEKRQKIREQNQKRVLSMQTKETRKRMKASKRKSDRINSGRAPKHKRNFQLPRLFRPSKWWR